MRKVLGMSLVVVLSLGVGSYALGHGSSADGQSTAVSGGMMGQGMMGQGGMMGPGMMQGMMGGMMGMGQGTTAHSAGKRHPVDPNSPSDVMMEACTTAGMGPEGHTIAGQMIDQMHGEGAHHKMHNFMDQMMAMMMGGQAMDPSLQRKSQ
ncbi:MAG: hypothetical protein IH975_10105 [Nitrospinae bacterium]|nr:hypothetical protein [Nitrospinota bacterium]